MSLKLVFLEGAKSDINRIAKYIGRQTRTAAAAEAFGDKIVAYCEKLAGLPAMLGRERPELRPGLRTVAFGNYVICLRYAGDPRHTLEIVNVLHGARDIEAFFADDDEPE